MTRLESGFAGFMDRPCRDRARVINGVVGGAVRAYAAAMLVERRRGCLGLIVTWLLSAAALFIAARVVPGVEIASFKVALVAALVLGLVNAFVRPIVKVLTLPVTVLTLGLFLLIVNGAMIGLAAWLVDGFSVNGLVPGVLMAVVVTVVSSFFSWLTGSNDKKGQARTDKRAD
jgi:putative membrane protein